MGLRHAPVTRKAQLGCPYPLLEAATMRVRITLVSLALLAGGLLTGPAPLKTHDTQTWRT
jgi:hypothetical protein